MALVWLLVAVVALSAFGILAVVAGADTRSGADGEGFLGRRTHQPDTWW